MGGNRVVRGGKIIIFASESSTGSSSYCTSDVLSSPSLSRLSTCSRPLSPSPSFPVPFAFAPPPLALATLRLSFVFIEAIASRANTIKRTMRRQFGYIVMLAPETILSLCLRGFSTGLCGRRNDAHITKDVFSS